ncbi:hypothetical protein KKB14_03960 [Patescibacteria group bacterium]|nr:hypothetical protein [Patescibacteria group bacterium]
MMSTRQKKEKGQIWIIVALFMLTLIILFSLIADIGRIYLWQKKLEMAADAAALAGGQRYQQELTPALGDPLALLSIQSLAQDQARIVAVQYAWANGVDTDSAVVTDFLDELNGTSPGTDGIAETIQVQTTKIIPLMFTKMLGITSKQVWALSAVRVVTTGTAAPPTWPCNIPRAIDKTGFSTTLISSIDNGDGTTTLTLTITSDEATWTPALSHVSFELPAEAREMAAATATSTFGYPVEIVNPDPTTGISGIKFDETNLGEDGHKETCTFEYTIPTSSLTDMTVGTKAGQKIGMVTIPWI